MSDNFSDNNGARRADSSFARYSRSAGVSSYHRKRRQGSIFRIVVCVMFVVVIGGALLMLGSHYFGLFGGQDEPEEQQQEEATPQVTTAQPAQITLVAAGDVVMNSAVVESGALESGAYNFDHLLKHVSRELSDYDLRLVVQETNLPGSKFGFGNTKPLNAPQELGRAEVAAGFNVIARATDHTLDNGTEGVHNELQWWASEYSDLPLLGIAEPEPEVNLGLNDYVNNVYVFEKDGLRVAILNHTWGVADENRGFISALAEDKIASDVQMARDAGADMIVACPHWGVEYSTELSEEETAFAQVYANYGVDVIIGTHPRVLQRVEVLQNGEGHQTVCFYSLGCLISSLDSQSLVGGLAEVTLSRDGDGNCTVSSALLKPVVTHRGTKEEFGVYLASNYSDDLAHGSWDWGLTPEEVNRRCSEILGEGYDAGAMEYRVAL